MNFVAGILIVIAFTYIGIGIDNFYKTKIAILSEFCEFIQFAQSEICYLKTNIIDVTKKYNLLTSTKLSLAFTEIKNPVLVKPEDIHMAMFSAKEKQLFITFIQEISRLDSDRQKAYAVDYQKRIKDYITTLQKEEDTKGKLAKKLAPLLGLGIMIVII